MSIFARYFNERPGQSVCVCAALLAFYGVWQAGLNLDACMYASVARTIAQSGDWLSLSYTQYYHSNFAEHPPLAIYLMALIFKLCGASDPTSRLVGSMSVVGATGVVYLIGRDIRGVALGFVGALILLVSYNFSNAGASALLDGPLSFFVLLALWLVIDETRREMRLPWAGLALGLAFLTKGLAALPAYAAIVLIVLSGDLSYLRRRSFYLAAFGALGLPLAFILIEATIGPNIFWGHYFGQQLGEIYEGARTPLSVSWYEFAPRWAILFFPWSVLAVCGVVMTLRGYSTRARALVITLGFFFLAFSFSKYVFNHYFLPLYPLAALLAALPIVWFLEKKKIALGRAPILAVCVFAVAFVVATSLYIPITRLRRPEVTALREDVLRLIAETGNHRGVVIGAEKVDWDLVAQAKWYWNADLNIITDTTITLAELCASGGYAFALRVNAKGTRMPEFIRAEGNLALCDCAGK